MRADEAKREDMQDAPKTVLVGVTGCIAAYKACEIVRGLQKAGLRVKVVMTRNATRFVGPVTFKTLTREPVAVELFDAPGDPVHHISLAKEADLFLIAPCTANVIAKLARGVCDDLLTTTALATTAPLLIAPAMNTAMWQAPVTVENLQTLRERGFEVIEPASGMLACGDAGQGRLASVEGIVAQTVHMAQTARDLQGRNVLITAGPTHEPIDPVRYIGNRSSGKSGYALAREARRRGAHVTLVAGPCALPDPALVDVVHVQTAEEMLQACRTPFSRCDIAIFSAAVADFRPVSAYAQKIKKNDGGLTNVELVENPDIIATLAADKGSRYVIGYAAETVDPLAAARDKLVAKHADLIVANDVSGELGFGTDTNKVSLVSDEGIEEFEEMSKEAIARVILDHASTALGLR